MFIPFEEGEEIVMKVHRHWLFIWTRVVGLLGVAAVPIIAYLILKSFGVVVFTQTNVASLVALGALWALVLWAAFWQFWTTYYMDIWVVTNRRIIDIDYHRLFDRNIAVLRLERVQDITTHVRGVLPWLLKYGSVTVQTAGSDKEFVIDQIANPEKLRDAISGAMGKAPNLSM